MKRRYFLGAAIAFVAVFLFGRPFIMRSADQESEPRGKKPELLRSELKKIAREEVEKTHPSLTPSDKNQLVNVLVEGLEREKADVYIFTDP